MKKKKYIDAGGEIEIRDNINYPKHYELKGLEPYESIDVIRSSLEDGFKYFCLGNVFKYIIRHRYKNGIEDLKKARVYLDWMIESLEDENDTERISKPSKISR